MELSPLLYHRIIRPKWITKMYIHNKIEKHLNLSNKSVLDFGAGTGAICSMINPENYIGIDPDAKRIHFARVLKGKKLPVEDHSMM